MTATAADVIRHRAAPARALPIIPCDPFLRFFLPGPIAVHADVMRACALPMVSHRAAAMTARVHAMQPLLQAVFRTTRQVIISTSAATGLKEMAMRCVVADRVLVPVGGLFAERFAVIAERCGKTAVRIPVPHDRPVTPEELREALIANPEIDAVALVHSETGTGVLAPLEALAATVKAVRPDAMLIVDGVTSVGGLPVETDAWGIDFVLTGSQKAMGLPPGLAFAVASERAVARARTQPVRGWYFDLQLSQKSADGDTFPQTPAVPLINALEVQLRRIATEGVEARWARHAAMRAAVDQWAAARGWTIVAAEGSRSWTVTALLLPESLKGADLVAALAHRGWTFTDGLPPHTDRHFRIGHMGDVTVPHLLGALQVVDEELRKLLAR